MASRAARTRQRNSSLGVEDSPITAQELFFEKLIDRIEKKETIHQVPRLYYKGQNVENHLLTVERYFKGASIQGMNAKCVSFINSLDETVQVEMFAQLDFDKNENNYGWLVNTLRRLYGRKENTLSPRVHLLQLHQSQDQSPADYASQLRVEAYHCWPRQEINEQESFLLKVFLNGLYDRNTAMAIKAVKPEKLEIAAEHAQRMYRPQSKEESRSPANDNHLRVVAQAPDNGIISHLQTQIADLQKKVSALEQLFRDTQMSSPINRRPPYNANTLQRPPYNANPSRNYTPRRPITCYNCYKEGHIARDCPQQGRPGPNGRTYAQNDSRNYAAGQTKKPFFRQVCKDLDTTSVCDDESALQDVHEHATEEDTEKCYIITKSAVSDTLDKRPIKPRISFYKGNPMEEQSAQAWSNFVCGHGRKPKKYSLKKGAYQQTLISVNHSEPAKNKPVVIGKCAGVKAKIFIDSGAEMNVIDADFLNEIIIQQRTPVKFVPGKAFIQCANGSKMAVTGHATFLVELGNARVQQKFMVVQRIFPKIIIGLRTMKTMSIIIDAVNDGIIVNEETRVPFLSRISPDSTVQGNGYGATLGAGACPGY
jgi:hypothetical protein